jgi:AhpD family alkylhydroperoxidase
MAGMPVRSRAEVEQDIRNTFGFVPNFLKNIPDDVIGPEWQLLKHYELEETVIPNKYKELLMLAVHAGDHCRYCTLFHTEAAKMFGATDAEVREAVLLAKYTVGWSAWLNGTREDFDRFAKEVDQIAENMKQKA